MQFEKIIGIAACDCKGVIGNQGKLPWHSSEDLQHFSNTILQHPIIMGRRTFLSLPHRYLFRRETIVFTRQKETFNATTNMHFVSSMAEFLALKKRFKEIYVIGGAQIYTEFLQEKLINEFLLTQFDDSHEGDTFFPLSLLDGWSNMQIHTGSSYTIYRYIAPNGDFYAHNDI